MNTKIPLYIVVIILIVIFISGGFSSNYFYKSFKDEIEQQKKENAEIIIKSKIKEDSLIDLSNYQILFADDLRDENEYLQTLNNSLYYELKKRNKKVFIVDTSFMVNANRIKSSTDKFYKQNDSTR